MNIKGCARRVKTYTLFPWLIISESNESGKNNTYVNKSLYSFEETVGKVIDKEDILAFIFVRH